MITALTVSYNTPEYLERLLTSFRKFYPDLPYLVIDGSDEAHYKPIKDFDKKFNIGLIHFNYNIHHGPGMVYGINYIKTDQILLVDSDMIIHSGGWLEMMEKELKKESYGIGDVQQEYFPVIREAGTPENRRNRRLRNRIRPVIEKIWMPYLHPAFALINKDIALQFPLPIKGGAPLLDAMKEIFLQKQTHLVQSAPYITEDLWKHTMKYVQHNHNHKGMGTVKETGGYHLQ
jgi:glycosyltransferase involved in cell wall biosynthesis